MAAVSVKKCISFGNTYPLDSDLSGRQRYLTFEQPGPCVQLTDWQKETKYLPLLDGQKLLSKEKEGSTCATLAA